MRIQHNVTALNSHRNLTNNNSALTKNLEKLSSGYRINRAGDDAAGLAISEKMRAQITGLQTAQKNAEDGVSLVQTAEGALTEVHCAGDDAAGLAISEKMRAQITGLQTAQKNAEDGVSLVQTAEGALTEVHSMLNRMVELATQSANGTYSTSNRAEMQKEIDALSAEIDRISNTSNFNGTKLFSEGKTEIKLDIKGTLGGAAITAKQDGTYDFSNITAKKGDSVIINGRTYTFADGATGNDGKTFKDMDALIVAAKKNGVTLTKSATATAVTNGVSIALHVGESSADANKIDVLVKEITSTSLGINGMDITTADAAKGAIDTVNGAIDQVSSIRSDLGALQNRLEHTINNLGVQTENITAAESRIRDVDMAKEMMNYTKNNILVQASQAMLAQANQVPQGVLQLLQ